MVLEIHLVSVCPQKSFQATRMPMNSIPNYTRCRWRCLCDSHLPSCLHQTQTARVQKPRLLSYLVCTGLKRHGSKPRLLAHPVCTEHKRHGSETAPACSSLSAPKRQQDAKMVTTHLEKCELKFNHPKPFPNRNHAPCLIASLVVKRNTRHQNVTNTQMWQIHCEHSMGFSCALKK